MEETRILRCRHCVELHLVGDGSKSNVNIQTVRVQFVENNRFPVPLQVLNLVGAIEHPLKTIVNSVPAPPLGFIYIWLDSAQVWGDAKAERAT